MSVWFKSRLNPWYIWIPSNPNLYSTKIIMKMRWQTIASNVSIRTISPSATPLPKAYDCVAVYIAGRRTSLVVYGWWPQPPTKKKKPFTLAFRICINTPSGSPSRECCIPAQDCFKGPRLAAVTEPHAPQVGTIEQSKVEKAISI